MPNLMDAVRISAHLPVETVGQRQAAKQIQSLYRFIFEGSTVSNADLSPFRGTWRYTKRRSQSTKLFNSPICFLMIDITFDGNRSRSDLDWIIDDLHSDLVKTYHKLNADQIAFYITVTPMNTVAG